MSSGESAIVLLRATLSEERRAGGRLLLRESAADDKYGPYRVTGSDRPQVPWVARGRRFKMYGTPEFLLSELREAFAPSEPPLAAFRTAPSSHP